MSRPAKHDAALKIYPWQIALAAVGVVYELATGRTGRAIVPSVLLVWGIVGLVRNLRIRRRLRASTD